MSNNGDGGVAARAAAELYAGLPEDFTGRRRELAAAARAAGDREAARLISALRKPTRAAWVVNRLAHAEPGVAASLADLAAGLRAAEEARDGPRLRDLSSRRQSLIDGLAQQALALAGLADPPPALRAEVTATLSAALASQEVADQLATGTLTHAVTWSGFGLASQLTFSEGDPAPAGEAAADELAAAQVRPGTGEARDAAPVPLPAQAPRTLPAQRARTSARPDAAPPSGPSSSPLLAVPAEREGSAASSALPVAAPPTTGRAARRAAPPGPSVDDAERSLATASAIAAQAAAAEERLEVHVRDLEQQLTTARAGLADARLKARHAESAERKARQALARIQSTANR
ncbi:MAG TPA: hypothetical protein VI365_08135 [Trebonia sp.]